ncbi:MAG: ELWxxDGT repeat protein [Pirellulales bacterium]
MNPGAAGTVVGSLTNVNGTLFFNGSDGIHGTELWKSDGTSAGTIMVKDITPGGPSYLYPKYLTNVNGTLFFSVKNALWKSDGTSTGTIKLLEIASPASISSLTNFNGTLFFQGTGGLWKSDGTAGGTTIVKVTAPSQLTVVNDTLYFASLESSTGLELWRSDGTEVGTQLKPGSGTNGSDLKVPYEC